MVEDESERLMKGLSCINYIRSSADSLIDLILKGLSIITFDEDDDNEGPCYILPDGTRVDLAKSKAGKDLCRLPVSVLTLYIMLTPFSCPK